MEYKKVKVNIELTLPVESVVPNLPVTLLPSMSSAVLRLLESQQAAIDVAVGEKLLSTPAPVLKLDNQHQS